MQTLIELADGWHPAGYRTRVPLTPEGEIPEPIQVILKRHSRSEPDGRYVRAGEVNRTPLFRWEATAP